MWRVQGGYALPGPNEGAGSNQNLCTPSAEHDASREAASLAHLQFALEVRFD